MPLPCMNPFAPKKAPPRKATTISPLKMDATERSKEFGLDYVSAHCSLDDNLELFFDLESADWINDLTGENYHREKKEKPKKEKQVSSREIQKIQANAAKIQEDNQSLKCKNDILKDMLAEVYSEFSIKRRQQSNKSH